MRQSIILFVFLLPLFGLNSQSTNILKELKTETKGGGIVQIYQDKNIESAFEKFLEIQKKTAPPNGYRICIFADAGQAAKRNAENARQKFLSQFENLGVYTKFTSPSWYRVYVGDFRTKSETMKYLKIIERDFPGAYSVPENISSSNE